MSMEKKENKITKEEIEQQLRKMTLGILESLPPNQRVRTEFLEEWAW